MKILILDDSPLRHSIFRRRFEPQGCEIKFAFTAQEAIDFLMAEEFDLILLDHDLGGNPPEYYGQDCDPEHHNTGSEVARWMAKNPKPYEVVVHSRNPVGVHSIISILTTIPECKWFNISFDKLVSGWGLGIAT